VQGLILKMQDDFNWTFMAGLALAILLFIVLVVVVSAMRVKTYRDRFLDISLDNTDKTETILTLEEELEALKVTNDHNEQTLKEFAKTKEILKATQETLLGLQENFVLLEKEFSQTQNQLSTLQNTHEDATKEQLILRGQYDTLQEDTNRLRINNSRLLMKLQSEERQASLK